jgi:hypothetical protein
MLVRTLTLCILSVVDDAVCISSYSVLFLCLAENADEFSEVQTSLLLPQMVKKASGFGSVD